MIDNKVANLIDPNREVRVSDEVQNERTETVDDSFSEVIIFQIKAMD